VAGALTIAGGSWWIVHATTHDAEPAHVSDQAPAPRERGHTAIVIVIANETPEQIFDGTVDALLRNALYQSPHALPYAGATLRELATELASELDPNAIAKRLLARDGRRAIAVQGKVAAHGKGYAISLTATDAATGVRVFEHTDEVASSNDVNRVIGGLAAQLLHALGEPLPAPGAPTPTGLSDNLEADHEDFVSRTLGVSGKYADAIAHGERAIALDPQFSIAHAQLGIAYWNVARYSDADRELKVALSAIDRMGEHDRLQFLGGYYSVMGEYDRSIAALKELVDKWPSDPITANNLALMYARMRDLKHALEVGAQVAHEHPRSVHPRSNLAVYDSLSGKFADAVREANSVVADFPRPAGWTYLYLAIAEHGLHDDAAAFEAAQTLEKTDPSLAANVRADLLLATGRTDEAVRTLEAAIGDDKDNRDALLRKQALLAEARLRQGDRARARVAADAAAASAVASTRFMAARAYVATGDPAKALALADKLDAQLAPDARLYGALVRGEALLARGAAREAVAAFESALHVADSWFVHEALARAYIELGAFAEAHRELAVCTARIGEGSSAFMEDLSTPTMRYAFYAQYYLARTQEGISSPDAHASYAAFLAGLAPDDRDPRVVDARKRLHAHSQ
jgi:tetratricopeptide (TPR) repeat protein